MQFHDNESILPIKISETGKENEPLSEVIFCDSMSGGAKYENGLPMELSLVRRMADGTEFRARYIQSTA